eukprot:2436567-Rhodomonas_salina.1
MGALDQASECVKRAVVTVRNRAPREKWYRVQRLRAAYLPSNHTCTTSMLLQFVPFDVGL